jgi:hypothetical protein
MNTYDPTAHNLDRLLFTTVTAQLKSKAVTVKTGTLVDAVPGLIRDHRVRQRRR